MDIDIWLQNFKTFWLEKNIEGILGLFSSQVEYWENPYDKYTSKQEIQELWKYVSQQENIGLDLSLFCGDDEKYSVYWNLKYEKLGEVYKYAGIYLIKLDNDAKCFYFMQIGEQASK